jgi:hypothetical protein
VCGNGLVQSVPTSEKQRMCIEKICRQLNNSRQTQQEGWLAMNKLKKSMEELTNKLESQSSIECKLTESDNEEDSSISKELDLRDQIEKREMKLMEVLESAAINTTVSSSTDSRDFAPFVPGPVGDLPIHDCFLLDLTDFGKKVIERFFNTSQLLSLPYTNDLDPWRERPKCHSESREDGLYTGETVLHIAIVKENTELVKFLTKRGVDLSSRATGAFFQPKWIRPRVQELTKWQWLMAIIGGLELEGEIFAVVKQELNEYYGYSFVFLSPHYIQAPSTEIFP